MTQCGMCRGWSGGINAVKDRNATVMERAGFISFYCPLLYSRGSAFGGDAAVRPFEQCMADDFSGKCPTYTVQIMFCHVLYYSFLSVAVLLTGAVGLILIGGLLGIENLVLPSFGLVVSTMALLLPLFVMIVFSALLAFLLRPKPTSLTNSP